MAETVTCPHCAEQVVRGPAECPHCGRSLRGAAKSPPAAVPTTSRPQQVTVTDIDMPFFSMMGFMLKWFFASLPVLFMIMMFLAVMGGMFTACVAGLSSQIR